MVLEERLQLKAILVGQLETNCYLVFNPNGGRGIIIDPGGEAEKISKTIKQLKFTPQAILLTHGHLDHCGAADLLRKSFSIPVFVNEFDRAALSSPLNIEFADYLQVKQLKNADRFFQHGAILEFNSLTVEVFHAPGHTPGSSLFLIRSMRWLFSGDVLFAGDIGRTDLPGGDERAMRKSLQLFRLFPQETRIFPGHGPQTTLEDELNFNPYLQ